MCGGKPPKQKAMPTLTIPVEQVEEVPNPAADPELKKKKINRGADRSANILIGPSGAIRKATIGSQSLMGS